MRADTHQIQHAAAGQTTARPAQEIRTAAKQITRRAINQITREREK